MPAERIESINRLGYGELKDHLFFYNKLTDQRVTDQLDQLNPHYILTAFFSYKIPDQVIQRAQYHALNFHPSLLPKYRGGFPQFYIIKHQDTKTGITLHQLTEHWDSGAIAAQFTFDVSDQDTFGTLTAKTENQLMLFLDELYPTFLTHSFSFTPQKSADYFPKPSDKDRRIHWSDPSAKIQALIRAGNAFFPSHTTLQGSRISIHESHPSTHELEPGTFKIIDHQWVVGTADNSLIINLIETPYGFYSGTAFINQFNFAEHQEGQLGSPL